MGGGQRPRQRPRHRDGGAGSARGRQPPARAPGSAPPRRSDAVLGRGAEPAGDLQTGRGAARVLRVLHQPLLRLRRWQRPQVPGLGRVPAAAVVGSGGAAAARSSRGGRSSPFPSRGGRSSPFHSRGRRGGRQDPRPRPHLSPRAPSPPLSRCPEPAGKFLRRSQARPGPCGCPWGSSSGMGGREQPGDGEGAPGEPRAVPSFTGRGSVLIPLGVLWGMRVRQGSGEPRSHPKAKGHPEKGCVPVGAAQPLLHFWAGFVPKLPCPV